MYTNHPYGYRPGFFLVPAPQMPLPIAQPRLRLWGDIFHTKPLLQLVEPGNQARLHDNLKTLISKNPELSTLVSAKSHLILMKRDGNDSARALMFGVLIAASVAIHNQTDEAADMQETLNLLLASAVDLRGLYSEGHGYLVVQSGKFPGTCNAVIQLIEWIKHSKISTTDLVYLANKGHEGHLPDSSLTLALTDLSHYVFYLAAQASLKDIPFKHEQEKVHFIRERDDKLSRTMLDLLRTNVSYTASNRHLIYDYLKVRSQHMTIATNLDAHMLYSEKNASPENPCSTFLPANRTMFVLIHTGCRFF